jgi:hypothetical protein
MQPNWENLVTYMAGVTHVGVTLHRNASSALQIVGDVCLVQLAHPHNPPPSPFLFQFKPILSVKR